VAAPRIDITATNAVNESQGIVDLILSSLEKRSDDVDNAVELLKDLIEMNASS